MWVACRCVEAREWPGKKYDKTYLTVSMSPFDFRCVPSGFKEKNIVCGTGEAHSFLFLAYPSQLVARRQLGLGEDWWLGIGGVDGQVLGHRGEGCKGIRLRKCHFDHPTTHEAVELVRGTHPGCIERRTKCKGWLSSSKI